MSTMRRFFSKSETKRSEVMVRAVHRKFKTECPVGLIVLTYQVFFFGDVLFGKFNALDGYPYLAAIRSISSTRRTLSALFGTILSSRSI